MSSTNSAIRIPVPFKAIMDDSLIWLTDGGCITVKTPNRMRQTAPAAQKQMPILLPPADGIVLFFFPSSPVELAG